MNLKRLGMPLQLHWLWFSRTDHNRPWPYLPISEYKCTIVFFKASLRITHRNGKDILFWLDHWLQGISLGDRWLDLAAAIPMRRRRKLTLEAALHNGASIRDISGALTMLIILQYLNARQCLDQVQLRPDMSDYFAWRWTTSWDYSSKSAYEAMFARECLVLLFVSFVLKKSKS
jgi:hypothetical protein